MRRLLRAMMAVVVACGETTASATSDGVEDASPDTSLDGSAGASGGGGAGSGGSSGASGQGGAAGTTCQRPASTTCDPAKTTGAGQGQPCEFYGYACYNQWAEPCNVQNYFETITCCGVWIIRGPFNGPSSATSCEELASFCRPNSGFSGAPGWCDGGIDGDGGTRDADGGAAGATPRDGSASDDVGFTSDGSGAGGSGTGTTSATGERGCSFRSAGPPAGLGAGASWFGIALLAAALRRRDRRGAFFARKPRTLPHELGRV